MQRVGVLAVEMLDGSPHAATVHFAHTEGPLIFIFLTERGYRKSEPLLARKITRASMVLGSNESDMRTLQLDGEARLLGGGDEHLKDAYFAKFPKKKERFQPPNDIFFLFTPRWWRFTDWTRPEGKTIYTSDDAIVTSK